MFPFALYLITALVTGVQVYWILMWAIWGAPTHFLQFVALAGSVLLLLASFVALFNGKAAAIVALLATAGIWSYYVPAVVTSVLQLRPWHLAAIPAAFFPVFLLVATTVHALAAITAPLQQRMPSRLFRQAALPRQRRIVGIATMVVIAVLILVDRFAIGTERTIVEPATWNYTNEFSETGAPEIHLRLVRYPNCYERFYSREFAQYLEKHGSRPLPVTFVLTSDFGKVRGISIRRVGEFTDMGGWMGGGSEGAGPQCPW